MLMPIDAAVFSFAARHAAAFDVYADFAMPPSLILSVFAFAFISMPPPPVFTLSPFTLAFRRCRRFAPLFADYYFRFSCHTFHAAIHYYADISFLSMLFSFLSRHMFFHISLFAFSPIFDTACFRLRHFRRCCRFHAAIFFLYTPFHAFSRHAAAASHFSRRFRRHAYYAMLTPLYLPQSAERFQPPCADAIIFHAA
jgi:hypothetical protein